MERWKRNVLGLLLAFSLVYAIYFVWLYEASGGTMVVSSNPPEWTFPLLVGVLVFGIAFIGGWGLLAITDSEMTEKREVILQLLSLGILLGTTSAIGAFIMTGYLKRTPGALLVLAVVVFWGLILRAKRDAVSPREPLTDERVELIELRSWAMVGMNMAFVASIVLLLILLHLWNPSSETLSILFMLTWSLSMIGAGIYYRGRM